MLSFLRTIVGRSEEKFLSSLPSLATLIQSKQKEAKKGYVTSLDGRPIRITKGDRGDYDTHKALNSLLQSSGAIFAKHWLCFTNQYLEEHNADATIVISYHDELQIDCHKNSVEIVTKALRHGVEMADKVLKTNCPNDIEIKVGKSWKDVH
jgi:DNA polymerase-1